MRKLVIALIAGSLFFGMAGTANAGYNWRYKQLAVQVHCGMTVTTNLTMTSNLQCDSGSYALRIDGVGVTLDMNGYTITGPATPSSMKGIEVTPGSFNTMVRNGLIERVGYGVHLQSSDSIVRNVKVTDAAIGFHVNGSNNLIDLAHFKLGQAGVLASGSDHVIRDSHMSLSQVVGILVENGTGLRVSGNTVTDSDTGIFASGAPGVLITSNVVKAGQRGIWVTTDGAYLDGNDVEGTSSAGVVVEGYGNWVVDNHVNDNMVGIDIHTGSVNTDVRYNVTNHNDEEGIADHGKKTNIVSNRAQYNGWNSWNGLHVGILGGTKVSGGNNIATNNSDPAQCSPTKLC